MLGSFRMRLFLVLVLVALLITAVNSGHHGQIEPVLRYVMDKDYGVDERLFAFLITAILKRGLSRYRRPLPVWLKDHVRWGNRAALRMVLEPRVAKTGV